MVKDLPEITEDDIKAVKAKPTAVEFYDQATLYYQLKNHRPASVLATFDALEKMALLQQDRSPLRARARSVLRVDSRVLVAWHFKI